MLVPQKDISISNFGILKIEESIKAGTDKIKTGKKTVIKHKVIHKQKAKTDNRFKQKNKQFPQKTSSWKKKTPLKKK